MSDLVDLLVTGGVGIAGVVVGSFTTFWTSARDRKATAKALADSRELERRESLREEFLKVASCALQYVKLQTVKSPQNDAEGAHEDQLSSIQYARLDLILATDRFGMLLTKEELPALDVMRQLSTADSATQAASALEGVMHCIPSWHRGEIEASGIRLEFSRVLKGISRQKHPSRASNQ